MNELEQEAKTKIHQEFHFNQRQESQIGNNESKGDSLDHEFQIVGELMSVQRQKFDLFENMKKKVQEFEVSTINLSIMIMKVKNDPNSLAHLLFP